MTVLASEIIKVRSTKSLTHSLCKDFSIFIRKWKLYSWSTSLTLVKLELINYLDLLKICSNHSRHSRILKMVWMLSSIELNGI